MAGGRPSKYDPEYPEKARKLFECGCTDREVAEFFGVHETTIRNWAAEYPEFFMALKIGKAAADDRVEQSLYRRAIGYSHDAMKILVLKEFEPVEEGKPTIREVVHHEPYVEHYPPDTTAGIFWLKNRRPEQWRDVKAVEHSGTMTHRHVHELSDEELAAIATGSGAGASGETSSETESSEIH